MTLTMFLVLGGYYLLKTAREMFILSEGGAEVKSYSSAGQALLLLVLVPAYGAFASRVNRTQLVQWVTLFFAGNLVLFLLALGAGLHIGIVYFLWLGIFNVDGDRPVLGVCRRPVHGGAGQAALPADRRRQQPGRLGGIASAPASSWSRGAARLLLRRRRHPRALCAAGAPGRPHHTARGIVRHVPRAQDEARRAAPAASG